MDFRHSITVLFPKRSVFRHRCEMSEIRTFMLGFPTPYVSENQTHKSLRFRQVWISGNWISDIYCYGKKYPTFSWKQKNLELVLNQIFSISSVVGQSSLFLNLLSNKYFNFKNILSYLNYLKEHIFTKAALPNFSCGRMRAWGEGGKQKNRI